jgi:RHS repeat-associated protein
LSEASKARPRFYDHARHHDFGLARFLSPTVLSGKPDDAQSWNRYSYTRNNPLKHVDPDGRDAVLFTWRFAVDAVGHSAIGIQNRDSSGRPTGTLTVRHLWPAKPVGKSRQEDADYRVNVISEKALAGFQGGEGRGADGIIRIAGDAKQDAAATAALQAATSNPTYAVPSNTCSTFTQAGLAAEGIPITETGTVTVKVGPVTVGSQSGVVTPVSVYNSVIDSKDPRVQVIKPLDNRDPDLLIH